ncbi:MAG TPA: hypothetical protein HA282_01640 [Nanoarchaeota archaeon]|nr:hypothetical protein [Nanoarchaeota archaeon]HIH34280.1 hypothetical protein [Nanoarchaeota archaeon]HIH50861.1 hypothetical protein [Nanoarchaeota archaeon]HIH65900.1 hypothetical protein [Nanoarchaeota archaeon]
MVEESTYSELGKQLAEIGLTFFQVRERMAHMPNERKEGVLRGFSLATLNSSPDDSYRAAWEIKDEIISKSAARKLLETNLRLASRAAIETENEWFLEWVIQEAEKRGEAVLTDYTRRTFKEVKLKRLSEEFGI